MIFGGRIVRELTAEEADEPALLRAAYNLRADSALPEDTAAEVVSADASAEAAASARHATRARNRPQTLAARRRRRGPAADAPTERDAQ